MSDLQSTIEQAWEARDTVTPASADVREVVEAALALLDSGQARVAEPDGQDGWQVNQWLKKAVLLSFRLNDNAPMEFGSAGAPAFVGASRAGLHPSALPEDQIDPGSSLTGTETENRQSGIADWMTAEQKPGVRIEGYADALSVLAGQAVGLHVSSTGPTFTIEVLRTGDYQGRWARLMWKSPAMPGGPRTGVVHDPATRMVSANWPRSAALDTTGWPAGAYLAKLIGSDGAMSFVPFVVRHATSTGAVLLVHSMATWQAYNQWGGPSTYRGYEKDDKADDFELRSVAASFDRPYSRGFGTGTFLTKELPVVATAERLGLRAPGWLAAQFTEAGLVVSAQHQTRPTHGKARDASDPLHSARAGEIVSLYELRRSGRS